MAFVEPDMPASADDDMHHVYLSHADQPALAWLYARVEFDA